MRVKNVSGDTVDLPTLGLRVPAGEAVDVKADDAKSLLASGLFKQTGSAQPKPKPKPHPDPPAVADQADDSTPKSDEKEQ